MIMINRLPKEYIEVEYIQNSGTQYIDTGFIPNYDKSIKIEIVTAPTVAGCRYCLMSNYSASNHLSLELNTSNKGRAYWNNGQVDKTLGTMSISDKNTIIFEYDATNKQYNFIVNDGTANGNMNATGVSGSSLLIFVDQAKRFSTFSTPLQIYSIRIWEDNVLIKELIPCVRKSDNEVGMYDLANGIFLTNAGTGTFTAGNKVQVKVKKIKIKINETMKEIEQIKTKVNNTMTKVFNVLSTIIGTGTNITLQNTANLEFVQPPLPRGNSEQDGEPSPTNEVPITNVTGNVEVLVQNKNLFNSTLVQKGFNTTTGGLSNNGGRVSGEDYILLKAGTYIINANKQVVIYVYGENKSYIESESTITWKNVPYTFTLSAERNIRVGFRNSDNSALTPSDVTNIQLEHGSTATSYIPHKEQTFTFPLGNQRLMLGDYLADDGIHHVRKQVEWNGSKSNWGSSLENQCFIYYDNDNEIKKEVSGSTSIVVICDCYKGVVTNYRDSIRANNNSIGKVIGGTNKQVAIYDNRFSTVADFKTWLSANPITVEYVLAEEEIIPYTTEQQTAYDEIKQALSYNEQTNISGTSDEANPIFSVEAYQRN